MTPFVIKERDGVPFAIKLSGLDELKPLLAIGAASAEQAEVAEQRSKAWAESPTPPIPGSKSAKAWAAEGAASADTVSAAAAQVQNDAAIAAAAKQAVLDNIAGIDVQAGLTLQAVSRAALKAITSLSAGRQAYLSEAGREGVWVWTTGNFTSQIAADTDEALYIKANAVAASAGAWVRSIPDNIYQARWWGAANTTANTIAERDRVNRMLSLLPDFAILAWWQANVITKHDIVFAKPITVICGGFGAVRDPTSGLQGGPTWNIFVVAASDVNILDAYAEGQKSVQASANPAAFQISTITTATSRPVDRVYMPRLKVRNCSVGVIAYGDWQNIAQRNLNPVTAYPFYYPSDIVIENPDIECNYMGIELFYGVRNNVHGGKIRFFEVNAASGFHPGIRLLGTTDCLIENVDIDCGNPYGAANSGSWGYYVAADNGRQQNRNLTIRGGSVRNCVTTFYVDECLGYLRLKDVETFNPLDANLRRVGLRVVANDAPGGVQCKVENLVHTGCTYNGVSLPYDLQGYITHDHSENNRFIGNEFTEPDLKAIDLAQFGANKQKKSVSHINERFLLKPGPSYRLISGVTGVGSGSFLRFENLVLPEVFPGAGGSETGTNPADTSFMETSPANIATSPTDPGTVSGVVPKGSCGRYPTGAWAARLP